MDHSSIFSDFPQGKCIYATSNKRLHIYTAREQMALNPLHWCLLWDHRKHFVFHTAVHCYSTLPAANRAHQSFVALPVVLSWSHEVIRNIYVTDTCTKEPALQIPCLKRSLFVCKTWISTTFGLQEELRRHLFATDCWIPRWCADNKLIFTCNYLGKGDEHYRLRPESESCNANCTTNDLCTVRHLFWKLLLKMF